MGIPQISLSVLHNLACLARNVSRQVTTGQEHDNAIDQMVSFLDLLYLHKWNHRPEIEKRISRYHQLWDPSL